MIAIDDLKKYSKRLEFYMNNEEEYVTLAKEFEILLKQVDKIDKIEGIKDYEPMNHPFPLDNAYLRNDEITMSLDKEEAFSNCKDVKNGCVSVPKVVA